ncbi:MAG: hypothetical protein V3R91_02645 [Myxococcota bacterium]
MLRTLFLAVVLAVGAAAIDPKLDREERTLSLRLRGSGEIALLVARIGTELVARTAGAVDRESEAAPVASGPRDPEQITEADRKKLDRLLEEKLRE